jgi:membrane-associated protease RseP (regulator of RpoE activity)
MLVPADGGAELALRKPRTSAFRRWRTPVLLFLATVFSTLMVGGVLFSLTLLAILLSHEFGHFFTARVHGVEASPPYFIPFPSLTGTLGAVIRMRGTMPTRRALVDIGASGPIAGVVVALPLLVLGLALSHVGPSLAPNELLPPQTPLSWFLRWWQGLPVMEPMTLGVLQEGQSLLYVLTKRLVLGPIPPGSDVQLHPVAFAAWFGLLVTALNLLPIGQLDGGHVLYAVIGPKARIVGRVVIAVLVVLGLTMWLGWLLWALLGWKVIRPEHPPVDQPEVPLGRARTLVAWASLALLVLTFLPVPLAQY